MKSRRFSVFYKRRCTATEYPYRIEHWSHVLQEIDCCPSPSTICFFCSCRRRHKTPVSWHFSTLWYVPDLINELSNLITFRRPMGYCHCRSVYHVPWPMGQGQCIEWSKLCQCGLSERYKPRLEKQLDLAGRQRREELHEYQPQCKSEQTTFGYSEYQCICLTWSIHRIKPDNLT